MAVLATNRDSAETQGLLRLSRIVKSGNPMRRVSCLRGGYSFLREFRQLPPVAGAQWFPTTLAGNAPRHQFFLVSSHDLNCRTDLDLIFRYADRLSVRDVFGNSAPSYLTMDVRLAYRPRECLELAVVGRNLFDNHHPEMKNPVFVHAETVREVYATASWRY